MSLNDQFRKLSLSFKFFAIFIIVNQENVK